ncbi:MAG: hypothetical protein GKR93_01440 [Gammaproteobacteria bacterium]|nr:hypothetical protein [Gammaproteobacteria bacterium]
MAMNINNPLVASSSNVAPEKKSYQFGFNKVSARDRKFFTEQLSLLIETGNNLVGSLEIIALQVSNPTFKAVIEDICEQIAGGKSFSHALQSYPDIFSSTFVTLVSASEEGGYMDEVLKHIMDMEEKREDLLNTLTSAFTYPAFLVVFAGAVIVFILAYVFPKFTVLFDSIHDQLPFITLSLMWMSDILRNYWWALLSLLVGTGGFLSWWLSKEEGLRKLNDIVSSFPLLGELLMQIYLIQTMRMVGLSLNNGVSLVDAINSCRDMVRNTHFIRFIDDVNHNVTNGRSFSAAFSETDFIPDMVKQMVKTGEESGRLALVSSRVADYYQRDLSRRLGNLSKMIEPIMLLIMGVVVGLIVSSLILPIFKLSRSVH